MFSRKSAGNRILVGLCATAAVAVAVAMAQSQRPSADEPSFKPAAPREALMEWHQAAVKALRDAASKSDRKTGRANAWLLAELANVNQQHSDDARYREFATALRNRATEAAELFEKKDFEAAGKVVEAIPGDCKACHDVFKS